MPVTGTPPSDPDDAPLLQVACDAFSPDLPPKIAVAVSGGGDSMALLHLYLRLARAQNTQIAAVTVDHGLRPEAADEAAMVARFCARHDISHTILKWDGWDRTGNLMAAARAARYRLIAGWAASQSIADVVLGHTLDDLAETFLMRLARKSGPAGLAAMDTRFIRHGITWTRPLAAQSRADLRAYLRRHDIAWADDPTNEDDRFDRIRARNALDVLAPLGVTVPVLGAVSAAMGQASDALHHYARIESRRYVVQDRCDLVLRLGLTGPLPTEIKRRLWAAAIQWVNGADYPPRQAAFADVIDGLTTDGARTVAGCLITRKGDDWRVARELQAVQGQSCATTDLWDSRWQMDGPHAPALQVRPLGEGIRDCPDWRDAGLPRASLMATPAIWRDQALISAPMAGLSAGWTAQIIADFHSSAFAH
ncbi:tRNA lysidine(34) synthetase TilS [Yoonia sp. BS5-3]|uniref:tRNA(Ile)-lysidine synthase n=1 Tax=Yoonia phaeophyticola TaxID=3137369 RepID=A0ABZ3IDA1_9RHOB